MTADDLQQELTVPMTPRRFDKLLEALERVDPAEAFDCLFRVATAAATYGHDQWASRLLVELDPPCPVSCVEALRLLARTGSFDPGNRLVPFYLATQFGKRAVAEAVESLRASEFAGGGPTPLDAVAYWLGVPAVELVRQHATFLARWE